MVESAPTALRRTGLANRAMYMMFIKTLQAILLNVPIPAPTALKVPACAGDAPWAPPAVPTSAGDAPWAAFGSSSMTSNGSLASSRKGVGADPALLLEYPDNSHNTLTQSRAKRSML